MIAEGERNDDARHDKGEGDDCGPDQAEETLLPHQVGEAVERGLQEVALCVILHGVPTNGTLVAGECLLVSTI